MLTVPDISVQKAYRSWKINMYTYNLTKEIKFYREPPWEYAYVPPSIVGMPDIKPYLKFKVPKDCKKLYPEQEEIMREAELLTGGAKMFVLPTGSGKSILISHLILRKKVRTLVLLPTTELLKQQKKVLEEFWMKVFQYWDSQKEVWDITVMTNASFSKMSVEEMASYDFDMIIIDEVQKALWVKMREKLLYLDIWLTYSFSATPYTASLSRKTFELFFGQAVQRSDLNMLPRVYWTVYKSPYDIDMDRFVTERRDKLDRDVKRLKKQGELLEKIYVGRKNIMVLYDRVIHSESMYNYMKNKWYENIYIITGEMKTAERDVNLNWFKKNWWVLIASDAIAGTGLDAPRIDTVCIFFPNKFDWRIIQMVGRWLRKCEWKKDAVIIDWIDSVLWYQYKQRARAYKKTYGKSPKDIKEFLSWMEIEI